MQSKVKFAIRIFCGLFLNLWGTYGVSAQMQLTLHLPKAESTAIEISSCIREETLIPLTSKTVSGGQAVITIPLSADSLDRNPVLHYRVKNSSGGEFESYFAGLDEPLEIDVLTDKRHYIRGGRFYHFSKIIYSNQDHFVRQTQATKKLVELSAEFPLSDYLDFLIYHSFADNLLHADALEEVLEGRNRENYWLRKVNEHIKLRDQVLQVFFDTLAYYTSRNDFVMLNFWASTCGPCVENNQKLNSPPIGQPQPMMVGIQLDETPDTQTFPNIFDVEGIISSHFLIDGYPCYVIVKGDKVVYRTHMLSMALGYFRT